MAAWNGRVLAGPLAVPEGTKRCARLRTPSPTCAARSSRHGQGYHELLRGRDRRAAGGGGEEGVRPGCACDVCASHAAVIARAIEDATSPPAPAPESGDA